MTAKTIPTKYEINPGEWVDIEAVFDRHPALTDRRGLFELELHPDVIRERVASAKTGEVKNVYTPIGFTLKVSGANLSALIKILNAAPVNGDPLQAIVNLYLDTTANDAELEAMVDYLGANGYNSTLENVAAAYLHYVKSDKPLLLDVVTAESREYAITRVTSRYDNEAERYSGNGKYLSTITFNVPTDPETGKYAPVIVVSEQRSIQLKDLEGSIMGNGMWRIMHALEPNGGAPLGGFILERIEGGTN